MFLQSIKRETTSSNSMAMITHQVNALYLSLVIPCFNEEAAIPLFYLVAILAIPERNRFSKGIFPWVGFRTKWFEYENIERAAQ